MPNVLPTLRGKKEKEGATAMPAWMLLQEVDPTDRSVAAYWQRTKNAMFGGMQADIFEVGFGSVVCNQRPSLRFTCVLASWAQIKQLTRP